MAYDMGIIRHSGKSSTRKLLRTALENPLIADLVKPTGTETFATLNEALAAHPPVISFATERNTLNPFDVACTEFQLDILESIIAASAPNPQVESAESSFHQEMQDIVVATQRDRMLAQTAFKASSN